MSDEPMLWHADYEVGVDYIDAAHKELFLVINRFQSVIEERQGGQRKALCDALLRYLMRYTIKHFAEEEAYMLKNKYVGYEVHKQLHDDLKKRTVPHLIDMLDEQNYSDDAICRFSAVLSTWLASHILFEDHAIVGKSNSRWLQDDSKLDMISRIDSEFRLFADDLFGLTFEMINRHYEGEYLGNNSFSFYGTVKCGSVMYKAVLICDGEFLRYVVKRISDYSCSEIDDGALEAFAFLAQSWIKAAVALMTRTKNVELLESSASASEEAVNFFNGAKLQQSILWKSDKYQIGMAVKEVSE